MTTTTTMMIRLAVSLLALIGSGRNVLCYPGEIMDRLPREYENQLQVLRTALALDSKWSPVWSEQLQAEAEALEQPDVEYCMELFESDAETIDTFETIKKIMQFCRHSGMYVDYGVKLLGHSVQCFFNRHVRVHLAAVGAELTTVKPEFQAFLKNVIKSYQVIADKLMVVNRPLENLFELVKFYNDIDLSSPKLAEKSKKANTLQKSVQKLLNDLKNRVNSEFDEYCASTKPSWYDERNREFVKLKEIKEKTKDKKDKNKKDKKKKDKKKKSKKGNEDEDDEDDDADADEDNESDKKKKKKKGSDKKKGKGKGKDKGGDGEKKEKKKDKDKDGDGKKKGKDKKKDKDGEGDGEKKDKDKKKDKKKDDDGKKDKKEDDEKEMSVLMRADKSRLLVSRIFEAIPMTKMSPESWNEIFTANILMNAEALQEMSKNKKKIIIEHGRFNL